MEIFTREDLIKQYEEREGGGQMSAYQREYYTNEFDQHRLNDEWNQKAFGAKVGILLTSHPGNRGFLHASLETHKRTGHWLVLAYDNYWEKGRTDVDYNYVMPSRDTFDLVDTLVVPHNQSWGGVLYPYFWLLYFGLQTMGGFEYVYCANGDCVLEKPENFQQLFDLLGDGDIMGIGNEDAGWSRVFNTTGFLAKTKAAQSIIKHFGERLVPFHNYVKYTQQVGNTEARFSRAIEELGLKEVRVDKNPYNTQLHCPGGTWYDVVGFRHIHGEFNWAWKLLTMDKSFKENIPPLKYLDRRHASIPEQFLEHYRQTGQLVAEEAAAPCPSPATA